MHEVEIELHLFGRALSGGCEVNDSVYHFLGFLFEVRRGYHPLRGVF